MLCCVRSLLLQTCLRRQGALLRLFFFSPFCVFVCVVTRSPHFGNMLVSFFFFDVLFFSLFFTTLFSPFFLYCLCVHVCVCVLRCIRAFWLSPDVTVAVVLF